MNIPIVDDTRVEDEEQFSGNLMTSEVRVNLDPDSTVISIDDDDGT